MGISVLVTDELGRKESRYVIDPANLLHRVLPDSTDRRFAYVSTIDWYGNTVFNHLQIPRFLEEWQTLEATVSDPATQSLLRDVRELAERVKVGVHLYLKFEGD